MKKLNVQLSNKTFNRLQKIARRTEQRISAVIRIAIESHLHALEETHQSEPFETESSFVKSITKASEGPWYLLKLPNGEWGAFWWAGLNNYHSEAVFNGDYQDACAQVGEKSQVIDYIITSLKEDNDKDPISFNYNIQKIRKVLMKA